MTTGPPPAGLVYHNGGLGDFVLSLPAIFRIAAANRSVLWHYWGPAERLCLLPGFRFAPPALVRGGHALWGGSPDPAVLDEVERFSVVAAFGGRSPPEWLSPHIRAGRLALSSFPPPTGPRVPVHQARQLDLLGVPRFSGPCLPGWRRLVLPKSEPRDIVIHPGSGDLRKNVPAETWVDVVRLLRKRTGVAVEVALGPAEAERGGWERLAPEADRLTRCNGLSELLAVVSRARLFLGNDSGAAHLAGILGVPTVAVFGPSDPRLWKPLGPHVQVVQAKTACSPCTFGGPIACGSLECIREISAATIVERIPVVP